MKTSKYNTRTKITEKLEHEKDIIAYAMAFASFIFPKINGIKEIILFGSVSRGEAGKESDIDLFFDFEEIKDEREIKQALEKELNKFYKSKIAEIWILKGINNPIKINLGRLNEWHLKRSIISDGISLYSKYKEIPKNIKGFIQFNLDPIKNISKRNKIMRELFGRKEKDYISEGLIEKINGKKLTPSSFLVKIEHSNKIIKLLGKEKVSYKLFELWTDQIN